MRDAKPTLRITTSGNEPVGESEMFRTVQHWQLRMDGFFIADTSVPEHVARWQELIDYIAELEASI